MDDDELNTSGEPTKRRVGWRRRRRGARPGSRVIGVGVLARSRVSPQKPRGPKTTKYEKIVQIRKWFVWEMSSDSFFPIQIFFRKLFP